MTETWQRRDPRRLQYPRRRRLSPALLQGAGQCHSPKPIPTGSPSSTISKDGSRIIVAQKVSEDADHNVYYHPYMDIGDSIRSIDLTPGVIASQATGVLFDGMTEDGSRVFFTTKDPNCRAQDTDESADIYEAEVSERATST